VDRYCSEPRLHGIGGRPDVGARTAPAGRPPTVPDCRFLLRVLDVSDEGAPASRSQNFGPATGVIGYRDVDGPIAIADASMYGLLAYVPSADAPAALAVADWLLPGAAQVDAGAFSSYAGSGTHDQSRLGRQRGPQGMRADEEEKHISIGSL
jgi:aldehyde dehydrogenase (NAD+)